MDRNDLLASVLVDEALTAAMMPWACPSDFGPAGRYRLEELIGAGPRSLVYKAHDRLLSSEGFDAAVAIKIMRGGAGGAAEREALTARRVNHTNVVRVLDRGEDVSGCAYLVTEFLDGGDMSQRPVPWKTADAAIFMARVARGIQAAHSAGVVHCDLKPSNVMLTADGEPKIGDFDLSASALNTDSNGRGNIAFMSPEQFAGEENSLSPPSDIYALGGMLYHLVTGQLPNGTSHDEVSRSHMGEVRRVPVKGDLGRICARAMAVNRDERYHSAGELADDLERCLRHEPLPWARPRPHRRLLMWGRRNPLRAAAVIMLTVGGGAAAGIFQYERVQQHERDLRASAESVRLANEQVNAIKGRVRTVIRNMSQALVSPTSDIVDRVLPGLTWIEWLGDFQVLGDDGRVPASEARVKVLRSSLATLMSQGRGDHVDTMLTRYCLAYFLINNGDTTEPQQLLSQLDREWVPHLAKDDPIVLSIQSLLVCVRANAAAITGDSLSDSLASLRTVSSQLQVDGRCEPVRRLVDRIETRLSEAHPEAHP